MSDPAIIPLGARLVCGLTLVAFVLAWFVADGRRV